MLDRIGLEASGLSLSTRRALTLPGLPAEAGPRMRERFEAVRGGEAQGAAGQVCFWELAQLGSPSQPAQQVADVVAWGERLRADGVRSLVWIGLGGSALGPQFLARALGPRGGVEVVFLDNLDPDALETALAPLERETTHVAVVSKSGGTAETLMLLGGVLRWLERSDEQLAAQLTVITGPGGGLRSWAERLGLTTFLIPPGIGGRWSVLGPVGLLPAAAVGGDVEQLLAGAAEALAAYEADGDDPASVYALTMARALAAGRTIMPLLVYGDRLALFGDWVQQLMMESLGQAETREGEPAPRGPSILAARGTSDQHSMLQDWIGQPAGKWATFVVYGGGDEGPTLPEQLSELPGLEAYRGRTMREAQLAFYHGTASSLLDAGVPSASWLLPRPDARAIGALLMSFELATALVAEWMGVNPYVQPGVEGGKVAARALLARLAAGEQPPELGELGAKSDD